MISDESYLSTLKGRSGWEQQHFSSPLPGGHQGEVVTVPAPSSIYGHAASSDMVAKSIDQVNKAKQGKATSNGRNVYDGGLQAVSSARFYLDELTSREFKEGQKHTHAVLPIVVVPDDTLYGVEYSNDGEASAAKKINQFSRLLGVKHQVQNGDPRFEPHCWFMHLEVGQFSALLPHLKKIMHVGHGINANCFNSAGAVLIDA